MPASSPGANCVHALEVRCQSEQYPICLDEDIVRLLYDHVGGEPGQVLGSGHRGCKTSWKGINKPRDLIHDHDDLFDCVDSVLICDLPVPEQWSCMCIP